MLLTQEELGKINDWLCYLAIGIKENGLNEEHEQEIMKLGCRCLDHIDSLNNEYTIPNKNFVI